MLLCSVFSSRARQQQQSSHKSALIMPSFQDLPSQLVLHISSLLPQRDILSISATSRGMLLECSAALKVMSVRLPLEWESEEADTHMLKTGALQDENSVRSSAVPEQENEERRAALMAHQEERLLALLSRPSMGVKELTAKGVRAISHVINILSSRALDGLVSLRFKMAEWEETEHLMDYDLDEMASALLDGALPSLKTLDLQGVLFMSPVETEGGHHYMEYTELESLFGALESGACPELTHLNPGCSDKASDLTALAEAFNARAMLGLPLLSVLTIDFGLDHNRQRWAALADVLLSPLCRELVGLRLGMTWFEASSGLDLSTFDAVGRYLLSDGASCLRQLCIGTCHTWAMGYVTALATAFSSGAAPQLEEILFDCSAFEGPVYDGLCHGIRIGAWPRLRSLVIWNVEWSTFDPDCEELEDDEEVPKLMAAMEASGGRPEMEILSFGYRPLDGICIHPWLPWQRH